MAGLIIVVVIVVVLAAGMWVLGAYMADGRIEPSMGRHTPETTTPESWVAARKRVARAMQMTAKWYLFWIAIGLFAAGWNESAENGAGIISIGLALGAVPLLVGVFGAMRTLEPI